MRLVHYGRDGKIQINEHEYEFSDFIRLDPTYSVPWGFHTRVYERGKTHYATDGKNTVHLPLVDPYCDALCNREGELARLIVSFGGQAGHPIGEPRVL